MVSPRRRVGGAAGGGGSSNTARTICRVAVACIGIYIALYVSNLETNAIDRATTKSLEQHAVHDSHHLRDDPDLAGYEKPASGDRPMMQGGVVGMPGGIGGGLRPPEGMNGQQQQQMIPFPQQAQQQQQQQGLPAMPNGEGGGFPSIPNNGNFPVIQPNPDAYLNDPVTGVPGGTNMDVNPLSNNMGDVLQPPTGTFEGEQETPIENVPIDEEVAGGVLHRPDTTTTPQIETVQSETGKPEPIPGQYKRPQKIALLGERNTGTRWMTSELEKCFTSEDNPELGIEVKSQLIRWKHWFQEEVTPDEEREDTLVINMFRNVYEWTEAMRKVPHHSPMHLRKKWEDFVTTPWTMPRPKRDLIHAESTEPICYQKFHYSQLISCVKGSKDDPEYTGNWKRDFSGWEPIYEMRHRQSADGTQQRGDAYKSIVDMRADKIRNFVEDVEKFTWVTQVVNVQYEQLLMQGTESLISRIEELTGVKRMCEPTGSQTRKKRKLDADMVEWLNENVDWETEGLVGYEKWEHGENDKLKAGEDWEEEEEDEDEDEKKDEDEAEEEETGAEEKEEDEEEKDEAEEKESEEEEEDETEEKEDEEDQSEEDEEEKDEDEEEEKESEEDEDEDETEEKDEDEEKESEEDEEEEDEEEEDEEEEDEEEKDEDEEDEEEKESEEDEEEKDEDEAEEEKDEDEEEEEENDEDEKEEEENDEDEVEEKEDEVEEKEETEDEDEEIEKTTTSDKYKKKTTTSDKDKEKTTTSDKYKKKTTTSDKDKEETTTSDKYKKKTTTSDKDKKTTTSDKDKKKTTTSDKYKKKTTTSDKDKKKTTTSDEYRKETTTSDKYKKTEVSEDVEKVVAREEEEEEEEER